MNVFHGTESYAAATTGSPGPVVTIGNFDGVHLGHRSLIDATRAMAADRSAPTCVLTFDPAPRDVLRPDNDVPRIQSLDDKLHHLDQAGVDQVVVEPFDRALATRTARWFADEILCRRLRVQGLVVGWDFRFGARRAGTVDDLIAWLEVPVSQVQPLILPEDEHAVSSSRVRTAIRAGHIPEAHRLLGRPHEVVGEVMHGEARGRELGFPTANVRAETALLPPHGVYAVRAAMPGSSTWHDAVANLGTRPTFAGAGAVLEVHLLDWTGDLYGQQLRVALVGRIRDERRFDGPQQLRAAVRADVQTARELLAP